MKPPAGWIVPDWPAPARVRAFVTTREGGVSEGEYGSLKFPHTHLGTVGAVAIDKHGNLAAATSTGGLTNKRWGRVGDSPIIGAGTYCTSQAAVSMTGVGERIMVLLSAKRLCDLMTGGLRLEEASRQVMKEIEEVAPGSAGLIALDALGHSVTLWDTPFMAMAQRKG